VEKFPATFNSENWPPLIRQTVAKAGLASVDEVDLFLFTQMNVNTIKDVMQRLNQPLEKTHWIMDPQPGDVVLFCATGIGLAMACAVFKW
jgi:3-oxoacyl-[acyl-carrier-protein] synthase-3